ncbi:MAG: [LysW]-aminoadipate kinase [Anaerolineales bacterium]|nr:[LysW]-aminoadipate kinase [Anaerolineales bacterium]
MVTPITVIKLGGAQGMDHQAICINAAELIQQGQALVLVHGGSDEANTLGEQLGYPARFIQSPSGHTSRYTDLRSLDIFCMAVNGRLNTRLTAELQSLGVNALGLSGPDGRVIQANRKEAIQSIENGKRKVIRDDYSGKINQVNGDLIRALLALGCTPVIAPLALGANGEIFNVDADRAAAAVAAALGSQDLILLTAVPGLLRSFPDETSLIPNLPRVKLDEAIEFAQGRMKKKVLAAQEALQGGVQRVIISDGRSEKPITAALAGAGTHIT